MANKLLIGILVILAILPAISALSLPENRLTYTIVSGNTIVKHDISFSEMQNSFEIKIPSDSQAIESSASFNVSESDDYKLVTLKNFRNATLKYISESFVEKTKDRYFTVNLAAIEGEKEIIVILPEFATLKYALDSVKSSIVPYPTETTTDGKRIILKWEDEILSKSNSLLVIYDAPQESNILRNVFGFLIIILLVVIGYLHFKKKKHMESHKSKETKEETSDFTRNLFEEEKAIVEALMKAKNNELWQKQLLFEIGISKVKLSRKIRALEYKGIIEKVPYGNTNKIRLKKDKK